MQSPLAVSVGLEPLGHQLLLFHVPEQVAEIQQSNHDITHAENQYSHEELRQLVVIWDRSREDIEKGRWHKVKEEEEHCHCNNHEVTLRKFGTWTPCWHQRRYDPSEDEYKQENDKWHNHS